VHQTVLTRVRNLNDMRKLFHKHQTLKHILEVSPDSLRDILQQHTKPPSEVSRLVTLADVAVAQEEATRARDWVLDVLTCHFCLKMQSRQHDVSLLTKAVEKEAIGEKEILSAKESFYLAVTDPELTDTIERLKAAFVMVLQRNYVQEFPDISQHAGPRIERFHRIRDMEADMLEIHDSMANKAVTAKVDHFACAVPLSSVKHSTADTDHEGACPICQNSYTGADFAIEDLLADYPVRIKHCGHIVGRSCLERWMVTPKIDEAKYPFRTCPLCRIAIEGTPLPPIPKDLRKHLKSNRMAIETLYNIEEMAEMDAEDCTDALLACMSEEIAAEELLKEAESGSLVGDDDIKCYIGVVMENLAREKWAWGFRGHAAWKNLRDEWARSGVVRKQ
jgi:hypothetical protein